MPIFKTSKIEWGNKARLIKTPTMETELKCRDHHRKRRQWNEEVIIRNYFGIQQEFCWRLLFWQSSDRKNQSNVQKEMCYKTRMCHLHPRFNFSAFFLWYSILTFSGQLSQKQRAMEFFENFGRNSCSKKQPASLN